MKKLFLILFCAATSTLVYAQKSYAYDDSQKQYNDALQLFDAGFYGAARTAFADFAGKWGHYESVLTEEAKFYEALSAKNLRHGDAVNLMSSFVSKCAQSTRRHDMLYYLGDYYLIGGQEYRALKWFTQASAEKISPELRNELLFKTGYCYFVTGKHSKAIAQFDRMKSVDGRYASAVKYYKAHVDYEQGNLNIALKAFVDLEKDPAFGGIAPYYIAHISYLQGNYAAAIRYAEPLTKGDAKKSVDMKRIVADSHFALGEFHKAADAYERLAAATKRLNRADHYHFGMSLYHTGRAESLPTAAQHLSMVTGSNDELAQNAYYHLADVYLKMGDKKRARVGFEAASKSSFDKAIKEDAHFNRLKLAYELNFSPFNELITEFVSFIDEYPNSDKIDEAYDYMGKAFVTTKNYRQALQTMEKIKHKNLRIYTGMQRLAFYRGLELYENLKFDEASEFFDYSLKYGDYDPRLRARAHYWKGECCYRTGDVERAREQYNVFLKQNGASELEEFTNAHYNLGYTYFNKYDYKPASHWFLKFVSLDNNGNELLLADAYNRLGDCMYVVRNFNSAIEYYDKALATAPSVGDYSMLQKGICLGLARDNEQKIAQLKELVETYPKSAYCCNAYYETARANVALERIKEAIYNYKVVKERYPRSSMASKAMVQLGLLYYNNGEYDNSIAFYKRVINEYPSTPEASDALAGLRNVYMEQGDFDGYMAYTNTLGSFARVELHEQDSLMFISAERLYLRRDFDAATKAFDRYLDTFADGRFATNANYYLGDCRYMSGDTQGALAAFEYVAAQPRSIFTENALLRSGELRYKEQEYAKALDVFVRLEDEAEVETNKVEAIIGQMRCQRELGKADQRVASADKVIDMPQASPEILREASYLKAKSLLELGRRADALPALRQLSENTKSIEGAEAKYLLAQGYFDMNNLDAAEAEVFDYVEKGTPHQYWLARSFVLLADIYHAKSEDFQAQQYLESLRESYEADDDIDQMIDNRFEQWQLGTSQLPDEPSDPIDEVEAEIDEKTDFLTEE